MATTISSGTNPYKLGSPPDFGTLYSGRALDFDGVTDYVVNDLANFRSSDSLGTISVWVNFDVVNVYQRIFASAIYSNRYYYLELYLKDDGMIGFDVRNGSGDTTDAIYYNSALSAGVWYHVVVSSNGSAYSIYIDGDSKTVTVQGGANEGRWFADISSRENFTIGVVKYYNQLLNFTNGKITNLQIWDKAWSLSDVQYAYTHPEKLITHNSAVTSGTTISNLKAWYPCTEGNPRSPQTTVYDGSEKGLSGELLTNGDMELDDSSWAGYAGDSIAPISNVRSTAQVHSGTYARALTTSFQYAGINQVVSSIAGNLYLVSCWVYGDGVHPIAIQMRDSGSHWLTVTQADEGDVIPAAWTYFSKYITVTGSTFAFRVYAADTSPDDQDTFTWYVDDASVKEVQMGNHGTTTFYGDELVTNGDMSGTTTMNSVGFSVSGLTQAAESGSIGGVSNTRKLTLGGADGNIGIVPNESSAVGRTYSISIKVYNPSSGGVTNIQPRYIKHDTNPVSYGSAITATDTWTTITGTMLYDGTVAQPLNIVGNGSNTEFFYIDDWSIKEVGVAAGWTTADAEPLIPQTALMGMSKPMVFDAIDDYVNMPDNSALDVGANFTVSAWIRKNNITAYGYIVDKFGDAGNRTFHFRVTNAGKLEFGIFTDGTAQDIVATSNVVITANKLHHVMVVKNGSACDIYVDGALVADNGTSLGTPYNSSYGFRIGGYNAFGGMINEVSLWTNVFTLAEAQELFNDGVALDATTHSQSANLTGYWRNDGASTWTDRSTNSNHGTPAGSPDTILLPEGTTAGKDILGFPLTHTNNGWLNLSGSEYVDIEESSVLLFGSGVGDSPFSVGCWLNIADVTSKYFISKGSGSNREWLFGFDGSDKLAVEMRDESAGVWSARYADSANTGIEDIWTHLAFTYDGSGGATGGNGITLYLNGSVLASTASNNGSYVAIEDQSANIQIGKYNTGYMNGRIDELRIYNRELTLAEITKNWKHGKSKHS